MLIKQLCTTVMYNKNLTDCNYIPNFITVQTTIYGRIISDNANLINSIFGVSSCKVTLQLEYKGRFVVLVATDPVCSPTIEVSYSTIRTLNISFQVCAYNPIWK